MCKQRNPAVIKEEMKHEADRIRDKRSSGYCCGFMVSQLECPHPVVLQLLCPAPLPTLT